MFSDSKGNLWFGCRGEGFFKYDGKTWTDLSEDLSITATTGVQTIENTVDTTTAFEKYRIIITVGSNYYGGIKEIRFNTSNYSASEHPKPECTQDTDGDNIPNHLDLDSDDDGIFDIIEEGGDDFNSISIVDYQHIWFSCIDKVIFSNDGFQNYQFQLDLKTLNLQSIQFINNNEGWAVGNGLMHTIDGGENWDVDYSIIGGNSVYFVDNQNGWVVGQDGRIFQTINGGETWQEKQIDTINEYTSVYFTDFNNGWIVGRHPDKGAKGMEATILHTSNAGETWHHQTAEADQLYSVFFIDPNVGWAVGNAGLVLSTNDGGENWEVQNIDTDSTTGLYSVHFVDYLNGWTVGSNGKIFHTQNGGTSWEEQQSNTGSKLYSVFFTDMNNGWISGGDNQHPATIYKTDDGGHTWGINDSGIGRWYKSIYFSDEDNGWAVGYGGIIMRIKNGSTVGTTEHHPSFSEEFIAKIYPNPASSQITIETLDPTEKITFLTIYNINGQQLITCQIKELKTVLDLSDLSQGIYFVKIQNDEKREIIKVLKK
ncbi:MAG: YCF48-related protein [Bacteroidota bacterium]